MPLCFDAPSAGAGGVNATVTSMNVGDEAKSGRLLPRRIQPLLVGQQAWCYPVTAFDSGTIASPQQRSLLVRAYPARLNYDPVNFRDLYPDTSTEYCPPSII